MKNFLMICLAITIVSVACKKAVKPPVPDTTAPTIMIHSPNSGSTFINGDTIHFHGMVMDNEELHEYHLEIEDVTNSAQLLHFMDHVHGTSHHFDTMYVVSVPMHTDIKVKVEVEDEAGNTNASELDFHIHM